MLALGLFLVVLSQNDTDGPAPELTPISRNSVLFIESSHPGEEWQAFRLTDAEHVSVFKANGPAKVLFRVRTFAEGTGAVAAILVDERIVLTARVEPQVDEEAHLVGNPRKLTRIYFYMVKVPAGDHKVTLRYSEGGALFVTGAISRLSPTDAALAGDEVVPVAPPEGERGTPAFSTAEAGAEEGEGVSRSAAEDERADPDRARRGVEPGPRAGPREDEAVIPLRRRPQPSLDARRLTVRAPYFLFEVRGGVRFSGIDVSPSPLLGVDARFPMPGLDSRVLTLGLSGELAASFGDAEVHSRTGGAPIDVIELSHTSVLFGFDGRWAFYRYQDVLELYGSAGLGVQLGTMSVESKNARNSASSRAVVGRLRAGATLGVADSRPFIELAVDGGGFSSDLTRANADAAPGDTIPYGAVTLAVGYRVELLTDADVQ